MRRTYLKIFNVFHFFVIISPWKGVRPFILTNFYPLNPRRFCSKFGWNWFSGSGEEYENVETLRQRQLPKTMDKFWSEKFSWAKNKREKGGLYLFQFRVIVCMCVYTLITFIDISIPPNMFLLPPPLTILFCSSAFLGKLSGSTPAAYHVKLLFND